MFEPFQVYLAGLALSAGLIVAIGAQNAHVLRQGLKREYVFLVATICSTTDILLISLGTLGFGTLIASFPMLTGLTAWAGAGFLLFYIYTHFIAKPAPVPSALIDSFTGAVSTVMVLETPETRETILWYSEDTDMESVHNAH